MVIPKLILLFDIDGTLLSVERKGFNLVTEAIKIVFCKEMKLPHVSFSGKTDWQIYNETMEHHRIPKEIYESKWHEFKSEYTSLFLSSITESDLLIHNGGEKLLSSFHHNDSVINALLTGNIKELAFYKLKLAVLDHFFGFGAFGDDHWKREELGKIAVERSVELFNSNRETTKFIVIGDTPRDIDVAKEIGAISIIVTTGRFKETELKNHGADFVIHDLDNAKEIIDHYF